MATAIPVVVTEVKLVLNAEEARWLLGFLQNSHTVDEPAAEEAMRGDIFDALKEALRSVPTTPPIHA